MNIKLIGEQFIELEWKNVLFFDGVCGLCNWFVDFVIRVDRQRKFKFAPLQGVTAEKHLSEVANRLDSVVVRSESFSGYLTKSDAVIFIARQLGGFYQLAILGKLVPRAMRDYVYDWVADRRYQLFGKSDTCRLPTEEEKRWFLP